jgi:DNA-binding transcriptional LysR family regulator
MDIHTIEAFLVLASQLNFTKSANIIYLSQPAFSRQIVSLEDEVGCKLFIRSKRKVELTEEGKVFARHAQALYDEYCKLTLKMKQLKSDTGEKLRIGFLQDLPQHIFSPVVRKFKAQNKDIELIFHDLAMEAIIDKIRLKELDVAFSLSDNILDYQGISYMCLNKLPMYVVVSKDHPFKDRKSLTIEELRDEKFVMIDPATYSPSHRHNISMCKIAGFEPNICAYASYVPSLLMMVGYGMGIAFVSEPAKFFRSDDIIFIPLDNEAAFLRTLLLWGTFTTNPAVSQFTDICTDMLEPETP